MSAGLPARVWAAWETDIPASSKGRSPTCGLRKGAGSSALRNRDKQAGQALRLQCLPIESAGEGRLENFQPAFCLMPEQRDELLINDTDTP